MRGSLFLFGWLALSPIFELRTNHVTMPEENIAMKAQSRKPHCAALLLFLLGVAISSCTHQPEANGQPVASSPDTTSAPNQADDAMLQAVGFDSMVRAIFEDSKGNLWLGSDRDGLCRIDRPIGQDGDQVITIFDRSDGLCHNQVRGIQEDENGTLWFRTGGTISSFDGEAFTTHPVKDGKQPLTAPRPAEWKKTPGDVWIGDGERHGGIFRFDGKELHYLSFPELDRDHESFSITGAER